MYTQKTKPKISKLFLQHFMAQKRQLFLLSNTLQKKKFDQVFHEGSFQKISANLQITPDLCTFTEELLSGKLQNFQDFP